MKKVAIAMTTACLAGAGQPQTPTAFLHFSRGLKCLT